MNTVTLHAGIAQTHSMYEHSGGDSFGEGRHSLESVLPSLEQYVLFVQGKSSLSPLTLLCLLSSSPDWVSERNAEWNSLKLSTSVLCIQQVTTTFPQLLAFQNDTSFLAFSLPHGIGYWGIPRPTQIASISSFSWLQSHMYVCEVK